ncbi:hypothetical protein B0T18DRAFT_387569 [Schizothecium vesticola]|uniref:Rhodopsin domain-containing protein n=1 Tax=Schizothecium vesticola TaxID=314040 RepID=A0AA40F556_9PEZI|nr:hypothetical protein B0T18DRAFT_387569 [Schizothecium vesticola]
MDATKVTVDGLIMDPGHPKFNLSGPPLPFNPPETPPLADFTSAETAESSNIPGIFFGILVPHIVCTLVVLARSWSRLFLLRRWYLDDTLILLSFLFSTAVCVMYATIAASPITTPPSFSTTTRTYLALILYQLCLCLTKLSLLAFYLRIFSASSHRHFALARRLAWATVIAVLLFGAPLLFMSVFQCHPSPGLFFDTPMKCFTFRPLLIASAALHAATDAWLIALIVPCVVVRGLGPDLPRRQRVALAGVLSLSVFVIAASMTRLQISLHGTTGRRSLPFFVMTVLEVDLGVLCASAPTLRLVLARWWPKLGMGDMVRSSLRAGWSRGGGRGSHQPGPVVWRGSGDLTSVVGFHQGKDAEVPPLPVVPPLARVAKRPPTAMSLRSFMGSTPPPRVWGLRREESREELLMVAPREAVTAREVDDVPLARRESVGLEAYYDQYLPGFGEEVKRRSRLFALIGDNRRSSLARPSFRFSERWMDSQESFVLGMNDPNSPKRLSPVSCSKWSDSTANTTDSRVVSEEIRPPTRD